LVYATHRVGACAQREQWLNAHAGYNLVTGLGTPVAHRFVPDLVAYNGPGTTYAGAKVGALQDTTLNSGWAAGSGVTNVFSVFTVPSNGFSHAQVSPAGSNLGAPTTLGAGLPTPSSSPSLVSPTMTISPVTAAGSTFEVAIGHFTHEGSAQSLGWGANSSPTGVTAHATAGVTIAPTTGRLMAAKPTWTTAQPAAVRSPIAYAQPGGLPGTDRFHLDGLIVAGTRSGLVADSVLDELATDSVLRRSRAWDGTISIPVLPPDAGTGAAATTDPASQQDRPRSLAPFSERLAILGLAAGLWSGAGLVKARKRRSGSPSLPDRTSVKSRPRRD
jgi:hypothetical protein